MIERCSQCLMEIDGESGYSTVTGELLCGPCHFALWGPRARAIAAESEGRRPFQQRETGRGRLWLVPGTGAEMDPEARVREAYSRLRRSSSRSGA